MINYRQRILSFPYEKIKQAVDTCESKSEVLRELNLPTTGNNYSYLNEVLKKFKINKTFKSKNQLWNKNVKKNIFKDVNTKEKAYWLGFISADGHVPLNKNSVSFMLSIKDEDQLDRFIDFIGGDRTAKKYYIGDFNTEKVFFAVYNKELADSIKKIGIVSPKSKKLQLLNFKNKGLNLAYLLGYFDGDGTYSSPSVSSSSLRFLRKICKVYNLNEKIILKKSKLGECNDLYFGINLYKQMILNYKNSMPRKRQMVEFLKNKSLKYKNSCPNCEKPKSKRSQFCKDCRIYENKENFSPLDIKKRLVEGESLSKISREYGLSDNGLKKILRRHGIDTRNISGNKFKQNRNKKIISMHKQGYDIAEIACEFMIHSSTIKEIILDYKKSKGYVPKRGKFSQKDVLKDLKKTKSFLKTAQNFGAARSTIQRIGRKNGIKNFKT